MTRLLRVYDWTKDVVRVALSIVRRFIGQGLASSDARPAQRKCLSNHVCHTTMYWVRSGLFQCLAPSNDGAVGGLLTRRPFIDQAMLSRVPEITK
jgi:hypothetical protein